ncbi:hypothetical protein RS130_14755 [Paraglaciecola aquimarina]|uniref:Uncharacterized protein n=1 Tax=Paraglaciecola aquimarina TaxID=1235557 RepID=A0ABU3SYC1_9ALTE|nr:hypothetical protein [Paraglaciecola aquimarina]MDU0354995.1 hypothetical protein [Paraglaciecola aquimarina]
MFSFDLLGSKQRALGIIQHSAIVRVVLLLAGWLGVWLIAGFVEYTHHASVWFPPAGLTFATLFVVGIRAAPVLMLAAVLVTIFTGNDYHLQLQNTELIKSGVMFGIAHITPYYLGSKVFRWLTDAKS